MLRDRIEHREVCSRDEAERNQGFVTLPLDSISLHRGYACLKFIVCSLDVVQRNRGKRTQNTDVKKPTIRWVFVCSRNEVGRNQGFVTLPSIPFHCIEATLAIMGNHRN